MQKPESTISSPCSAYDGRWRTSPSIVTDCFCKSVTEAYPCGYCRILLAAEMNRLSRAQRDKITQFKGITGANEKVASDCLKSASWSLEAAIEVFYSGAEDLHSAGRLDHRVLEALFQKYKDPHDDIVSVDGISTFCQDLGVDPADIVMLVLSWHMSAATMCEYSKEEFVNGLARLGVDSVEKLKRRLPDVRNELRDEHKFREIYNFAFAWAKEKGQKCLQLDTAVAMWKLIFSDEREWQLIDEWAEFLQKHHNRAISKDTWTQLFEFSRNIKPDFSNFDENGAWPYLIDEFVEHMRTEH